ncbi:hypothetical protein D3C71_1740820 [compost metagenome]
MIIYLLRKLLTINIYFIIHGHLVILIQSEYPIQHLRDESFITQGQNGVYLTNLLSSFFLCFQGCLCIWNFHRGQNFFVAWQTYSDIISFRQQLGGHAEIEHNDQQYKKYVANRFTMPPACCFGM